MRVYIAGPYTAETLLERKMNCAIAVSLGAQAIRLGHTPVIPHTMYHMLEQTFPEDVFLAMGLELLAMCDEIWVAKGWERSSGTKEEIRFAVRNNIPVVHEDEVAEEVKEMREVVVR